MSVQGMNHFTVLSDDLEVSLRVEDDRERVPEERLVVDEQDADHDACSIGSVAWTQNPPLGPAPVWSVPP